MVDGHIEQARPIDTGAIVDLLSQTIVDDVAYKWMIPDDELRARVMPGFFRSIVRATLRQGVILHRMDNLSTSLWRPPQSAYAGRLEMLMNLPSIYRFMNAARPRVQKIARAARKHQPDFPFRYLQFVAVAEEHRGKGLGGAIVKDGLKRAEAADEIVYLETASSDKVSFFQHMGFDIHDQWSITDDGPHFTSLLKRP